jgi:universal stress protein E
VSHHEHKRVLVAVKPTERGLPLAVGHARFLAEKLNAEIRLISCVFESQVAFDLSRDEPTAMAAQAGLIAHAEADLERLAQSLRDWGATVDTRVLWRQPAYEGILDEIRGWRADLVVVGMHEGGPFPLTETDWQLMRLASCPMLIVQDQDFEGYETVAAAVDPLHRHAEPAGLDRAVLDAARKIAVACQAELYTIHAFPDPAGLAWVSSVQVLPGVFYGTENIEAVHRSAVAELVGEYGITSDRTILEPGPATAVIADVVAGRDIKLLVLGAVKRSRLRQAILGSTAERLVAEIGCDVLLVKPEAG